MFVTICLLPLPLSTALSNGFKSLPLNMTQFSMQTLPVESVAIRQAVIALDEVLKNERTFGRLWGRAAEGMRVEQHNPFMRGRRLSMVAGMALGEGIIAAQVVEGSFTRETFIEYLHDDVV